MDSAKAAVIYFHYAYEVPVPIARFEVQNRPNGRHRTPYRLILKIIVSITTNYLLRGRKTAAFFILFFASRNRAADSAF